MQLDRPLLIVGAARSGTTILGTALALHPSLALLEEPNVVWRYGNARQRGDYFPAPLAREDVCRYIRRRFAEHLRADRRERLLEKTPANSLRLAFVRRVLPGCKVIHLVRDGVAVAVSARRKWETQFDRNRERLPEQDIPLRELRIRLRKLRMVPARDLPWYLRDVTEGLVSSARVRRPRVWGPRFPGIDELARLLPVLDVCAHQWKWCVESSLRDCVDLPAEDLLQLRYEDLCAAPERHLRAIHEFAGLAVGPSLSEMAGIVQPVIPWRVGTELTEEDLASVQRIIGPLAGRLGYADRGEGG